jgi:hypothetical protein
MTITPPNKMNREWSNFHNQKTLRKRSPTDIQHQCHHHHHTHPRTLFTIFSYSFAIFIARHAHNKNKNKKLLPIRLCERREAVCDWVSERERDWNDIINCSN